MNFMVTLRNIKRHEGILSADYFPEDRTDSGHIAIREKDGEEMEYIQAPTDSTGKFHGPVVHGLKQLIGIEELPEKKTIIWY